MTKQLSSNGKVMEAFPAHSVKDLDIESDSLPKDKVLGVTWNVQGYTLKLVVSKKNYPEYKKGVLASVASIYDLLVSQAHLFSLGGA